MHRSQHHHSPTRASHRANCSAFQVSSRCFQLPGETGMRCVRLRFERQRDCFRRSFSDFVLPLDFAIHFRIFFFYFARRQSNSCVVCAALYCMRFQCRNCCMALFLFDSNSDCCSSRALHTKRADRPRSAHKLRTDQVLYANWVLSRIDSVAPTELGSLVFIESFSLCCLSDRQSTRSNHDVTDFADSHSIVFVAAIASNTAFRVIWTLHFGEIILLLHSIFLRTPFKSHSHRIHVRFGIELRAAAALRLH